MNANRVVTVSKHDGRIREPVIDPWRSKVAAQLRRSGLRPRRATSRLAAVLVPLLLTLALAGQAGAAPEPITIATGTDAGWPDVRGWTRLGSPAQQVAPWGTNLL